MTVYAIIYSSYESGDFFWSSDNVIYISLDQNKAIDFFNKEISWYLNRDDVELYKHNNATTFGCSVGKWSYSYELVEFELDKDLRYI
jgi:hypothetical protein